MFRTLKYMLLATLPAAFAACADKALSDDAFAAGGELPVEFAFSLPDDADSRAVDNAKTTFKGGDVIHIQGTFQMKQSASRSEVIRYGALQYNETVKAWEPVTGSELAWPNLSETGEFLVYYVGGSSGILTLDSPAVTYKLENVANNADPLTAATTAPVKYGHAVPLRFSHMCAHLTLTYLEPRVSEKYLFTTEEVGVVKEGRATDETMPFHNAFRIWIDSDKRLQFEFFADTENAEYAGAAYIASRVSDQDVAGGGTMAVTTYFLEPGIYDRFSLRYGTALGGTYEYLKYEYRPMSDRADEKRPLFEAGHSYKLDISRSLGVTITRPSDEQDWDENGAVYDIDVEQFLRAVRNSTEYWYEYEENGEPKSVKILDKTSTGTQLLHNINFKYYTYDFLDRVSPNMKLDPNVQLGQIFDGGKHYIHNLGCPLFRENHGTIQNLGIRGIKATFHSDEAALYEGDGTTYDRSRNGGLCMWNRATGRIANVRITGGVELTATVESKKEDGTEAHNLGCVIGSNLGTVENVELSGAFTLTADNHEAASDMKAALYIGGFTGQNAGSGRIRNVAPLNDGTPLTIKVVNSCQGSNGAFYVGGIAGANGGYLYDIVLPSVEVDGTSSRGMASYMGGIAGDLAGLLPTVGAGAWSYNAAVEGCIVSGSVAAGSVEPSGDLTCVSYTGGIAGSLLDVPVLDCSVGVSVAGTTGAVKQYVTYAAGGAFGRIYPAQMGQPVTPVRNLVAYGSALSGEVGDRAYVGNFAGLVPVGMSWTDDYAPNNIIVNNHASYAEIGGTLGENK